MDRDKWRVLESVPIDCDHLEPFHVELCRVARVAAEHFVCLAETYDAGVVSSAGASTTTKRDVKSFRHLLSAPDRFGPKFRGKKTCRNGGLPSTECHLGRCSPASTSFNQSSLACMA